MSTLECMLERMDTHLGSFLASNTGDNVNTGYLEKGTIYGGVNQMTWTVYYNETAESYLIYSMQTYFECTSPVNDIETLFATKNKFYRGYVSRVDLETMRLSFKPTDIEGGDFKQTATLTFHCPKVVKRQAA
jgi:hypothetical protein